MFIRVAVFFVLSASLFSIGTWGHAPEFSTNYLVTEEGNPLKMPGMMFPYELMCLLNYPPDTQIHEDSIDELDSLHDLEKMRVGTMNCDLKDFAEAMQGKPDEKTFVEQYFAMRRAMTTWILMSDRKKENEFIIKQGWGDKFSVVNVTFDLAQYEKLLNTMPLEFSAYFRGAYAYYCGKMDTAIQCFNTVLQLPAEQRKYKSTWASFMLGKIWLKKNSAKAFHYFQQTRDMVKTGFHDPLNFTGESLGWLARIDADNARYVDAIHRYAECAQEKIPPAILIESMNWVCGKIISAPKLDLATANDPLCREILTAFIASAKKNVQDKWFEALNKEKKEGVLVAADRLAWIAYEQGDIKAAEDWLEHSEPQSVRAKWVKAKLLLRAGKLSEGAALLREISKGAKNEYNWSVVMARTKYNSPEYDEGPKETVVNARDYASAETAAVLLAKQDYIGALDLFAHAGFWPDAAYVAERLVPAQGEGSLEQYVTAHTEDDPGLAWKVRGDYGDTFAVSALSRLRDLLARRLARQGEWEKAAQYYTQMYTKDTYEEDLLITTSTTFIKSTTEERPAATFSKEARMIASDLKIANDTTQTAQVRARSLLDAAKTIWDDGMELTGTELMPDWTIDDPNEEAWHENMSLRMEPNDDILKIASGESMISGINDPNPFLKVTIDEVKRKMASAAVPYRRYHYRFIASDMMWRCAQMLPDNDPLCAEALYWGGYFLRNREPLLADKFYKALVKRNPNLAIAQEANKLKWFPPKFKGDVLYHSPVQHIRKRTLAMWGCGGLGLLVLAARLIYKRSRKRAAPVQEDVQ